MGSQFGGWTTKAVNEPLAPTRSGDSRRCRGCRRLSGGRATAPGPRGLESLRPEASSLDPPAIGTDERLRLSVPTHGRSPASSARRGPRRAECEGKSSPHGDPDATGRAGVRAGEGAIRRARASTSTGRSAASATIAVSLHCWQGDDVGGFESTGEAIGGGLAVTGNYPGKARTADELRADLDQALSPDPRHAPAQPARQLRRDRRPTGRARTSCGPSISAAGSTGRRRGSSGWTSTRPSSPTRRRPTASRSPTPTTGIRRFWVDHGIACRRIGAAIGEALGHARASPTSGSPTATRTRPVDRKGPRERLARSLDEIFAEPLDPRHNLDAVEGKLFGIGSESYVVGSHEFYLGLRDRATASCSASTPATSTRPRSIADKISAVLMWLRRDAAARQPRRALGQRPRGDADRRAARRSPRRSSAATTSTASTSASTSSTPASTAWPPG